MNENETILERVKKLLAKGRDKRGNIHECTLAIALAQRLIEKHKIKETELYDETKKAEAEFKRFIFGEKFPSEFKIYLSAIQELYQVQCYEVRTYIPHKGKICACLEMYGTKTDLELAEYMLFFIVEEMRRTYAAEYHRKLYREKIALTRHSYNSGFAASAIIRMFDMQKKAEKEKTMDDLNKYAVICMDKRRAAQEKVKEIHPTAKIRNARKVSAPRDAASYFAGKENGEKVQLSQAIK